MALLMWVQKLAKVLKLLSSFRTVSVSVNARVHIACDHAARIGMSMLGVAPAMKLLQDRAGSECLDVWEPDQAQDLVNLCRRNALYLTIMGSLISAKRSTMEVRGGISFSLFKDAGMKVLHCWLREYQVVSISLICPASSFHKSYNLPCCLGPPRYGFIDKEGS